MIMYSALELMEMGMDLVVIRNNYGPCDLQIEMGPDCAFHESPDFNDFRVWIRERANRLELLKQIYHALDDMYYLVRQALNLILKPSETVLSRPSDSLLSCAIEGDLTLEGNNSPCSYVPNNGIYRLWTKFSRNVLLIPGGLGSYVLYVTKGTKRESLGVFPNLLKAIRTASAWLYFDHMFRVRETVPC